MEKIITIDGKEYRMKASAYVPRLYRFKFGRDMVSDLFQLRTSYNRVKAAMEKEDASEEDVQAAQFSILDLTLFENLAWTFIYHADPDTVPDTPDKWLSEMDGIFSIYAVLPEILSLWGEASRTTSVPVKK